MLPAEIENDALTDGQTQFFEWRVYNKTLHFLKLRGGGGGGGNRMGNRKYFSYFSTETYVVFTQKNCLNETILLSTQNIC